MDRRVSPQSISMHGVDTFPPGYIQYLGSMPYHQIDFARGLRFPPDYFQYIGSTLYPQTTSAQDQCFSQDYLQCM